MSRLILTAVALGALLPATAAAEGRFVDASARLTEEAFELRLESTDSLRDPQVRTSPGFVRVWFPGMRAARLDVEGDGTAVRSARVRPGVADTSVTIIRVGDMREVPLDAVAVQLEGSVARVRLTRSALPRPTVVETAPAPGEVAPSGELADLTADLEQTSEEAVGDAAEQTPAEASTEPASDAASEEPEEAAAPPLALTRSADAMPLPASDGPSTTVILLVLTLLLGGAYLAIRMFQKKKPVGPRADIEIVATKRLGARHQLLVVRALGEDHLLAVQQGKTERLASVPAPSGPDADSDGLLDEGALPFLKLNPEDAAPGRTLHRSNVEERPRFGADLMRLVAERSRGDRVAMPAPAAAPSEAIAGLLRLREKLGR